MPDDSSSEADIVETIHADGVAMVQLLGPQDRLLRVVEREHPQVRVHVRGNEITLSGAPADVARARALVDELLALSRTGQGLDPSDVVSSERILRGDSGQRPSEVLGEAILSSRGRIIRPKTLGQKSYVDAIDENTITFGIGPAGTGKTYLAMAKAVQALQRKEVSRIILSRPAIEAGERLGFLPGTLTDKIDPYLRPLYDALNEMMDPEIVPKLMASGTIEVAPLAYMRGRTLNDSFVVLDEAQNTTPEQMKMFLTRLGFGTRMVVTGDITQIDLPQGASGLRLVTRVLKDIDDISFSYLTSDDVVRHTLVGRIVDAYTEYDEQRLASRRERDEASAFIAANEGTRAQRRGQPSRPGGPRDHLPKRGMS
ncbi:phosphate starvation-inducible PhoH-like protein [Microbacterium dextranolyticum]|uniref:PhoH-like protein n=2 Tax=Microbacterium dextranolyticum TaxID=36806 RepID=A0A9W6HNI3_9MICO|nr:phosphate starvation-inducible PhoH-like protein [Microbacterium dextranolyticum]GLJ95996.1 PhoH-like protein [Microbacterium dextranolyticum]